MCGNESKYWGYSGDRDRMEILNEWKCWQIKVKILCLNIEDILSLSPEYPQYFDSFPHISDYVSLSNLIYPT